MDKTFAQYVEHNTDKYFTKTKNIILKYGDTTVVYGFFLREKSLYAPKFMQAILQQAKEELKVNYILHQPYHEGDAIPMLKPLFFLEGKFSQLSELETLLLQSIGAPFVVAYNAYIMCQTLPKASFISMGARHYTTSQQANIIDYGISVGSKKAQAENCKGFIGTSTDSASSNYGLKKGLGTMPHSLIGYAGSTLRAAEMYHNTFPTELLVVLVDYFAQEIDDTLAVCNRFKELAYAGQLAIRIDVNGSRFLQGLDEEKSKAIINEAVGNELLKNCTSTEYKYLVGSGVSAAAIFRMRQILDNAGFNAVKIIASSGFNIEKCQLMAKVNAPIDIVGTGSILSDNPTKTFTTADIISYNNNLMVKVGREYLIKEWQAYKNQK